MCCHGHFDTLKGNVGNWFKEQLVIAIGQGFIINMSSFCDIANDQFIGKITLYFFNTRLTTFRFNYEGKWLLGLNIRVNSCVW
ncbi:hypothetical protein D3C81_1106540 [compost metagenome]